MDKRTFFIHALRDRAYYHRAWVIAAFTVSTGMPADIPYRIDYLEDGNIVGQHPTAGEVALGSHNDYNKAAYDPKEVTTIYKDELPLVIKDIPITTYGVILLNAYTLMTAFEDKIPFINSTHTDKAGYSEVRVSDVERRISDMLVDDPIDPPMSPAEMLADKDRIYVSELILFNTYANTLGSFLHLLCVPITERSITTHPDMRKRRKELLKEYEGQLHDPAIQAKIQDELIALDREWIMADETSDFYISENKDFNTARKRMFAIHGPEAGFNEGGDARLVVNSLTEGWDPDTMPEMINTARAGSVGRGAETALGGEVVKFFLRVFQNAKVTDRDCGVKYGWQTFVDSDIASQITGFYYKVQPTDKWELVTTSAEANALLGKTVQIRSPMFCRESHSDYCKHCVGVDNSKNPNGLGTLTAAVGSAFMGVAMQSAHAKELKTSPVRFDSLLR